eukprot:TRINITY_DN22515_c0_g1_i5.p1 TRINITY_DN22515_c0_g1~~TRINITY_DN22515_c0_g1_i5.p1  ORF type:complete len:137 (+),score=49.95 TRINITY_DN22515_c0_g1_i5:133-543(+)
MFFFFFFKQKTAYEMQRGLVGSEMCIRDRYMGTEALDLMGKMLVFNPFYRITVDEALAHPFLAPVRDKKLEITSTSPVKLEFESEGDLGEKRLRELFMEEINYFKKQRSEGKIKICLLYTSPSPRDLSTSRMPSSA